MAQNSIQKYLDAASFHGDVRIALETWNNTIFKLEKLDNFLQSAEAADYPTSPLADLVQLRTLLATLLASADHVAFKSKVKEFIRI